MILSLILWAMLGALAGWIASMIIGRVAPLAAALNMLVGTVGAVLGGLIISALGGPALAGFNLEGLFLALGGALLWLLVFGFFRSPA